MKQNNNISQGYKNSSLGVIPEEWEVKKLGEILVNTSLGGNYENAEDHSGIPVVKMGNIERGKISLEKILYLPENSSYNREDVLRFGDLLLNTRNTLELVGKVAIWRNELPLALYNSNLLRMQFNQESVYSNWFMNYSFNSYSSVKQLRRYATGTTSVAAIYSRDLFKLKVALPSLPEQQKTAEILTVWDEAIEKQTALITQLETRKRGLMQQLLTGKKRLKGFGGQWEKVAAGNVFKNISIKGFENEELLSATQDRGMIPRNMLEGRVTMPSNETSAFKLVEVGNFVISLRSFQGGIEYSCFRGIVSPAYTVLKPKIEIVDEFYKYYFKSYDFIGHLAIAVIGIRDGKQISYDDFCIVKIPSPSIEEQTAIANIISAADNQINLAKQKLPMLKEQKKGLMQQLLTGKIRVKINN